MIGSFTGQYRFLSNFFPCKIEYEGLVYPSVENAYQAAKYPASGREPFTEVRPSEAKALGKKAYISVNEWNEKRVSVMEELLRLKFKNVELRRWLLNTGKEKLVEGNYWGDTFWGVCNGVGENNLGILLMKIRGEMKDNSFDQAMKRPKNFYSLSGMEKWEIDRALGILDWDGKLTDEQAKMYNERFVQTLQNKGVIHEDFNSICNGKIIFLFSVET